MTKRVELDNDGDEWIDINKRVSDEVSSLAMSENLRYGEALVQYLENAYAEDSDESEDSEESDE